MPGALGNPPAYGGAAHSPQRTLESLTAQFDEIARDSTSLIVCPPGRFELAGQSVALPRYLFPVSYTHLDVYKRQLSTMRPEKISLPTR